MSIYFGGEGGCIEIVLVAGPAEGRWAECGIWRGCWCPKRLMDVVWVERRLRFEYKLGMMFIHNHLIHGLLHCDAK